MFISFFNYLTLKESKCKFGEEEVEFYGVNLDKNGILFFTFLLITFIWYVFGFGRIFSGTMNDDPLMEDEVCRWYLYKLPFWITLMPIFLMIPMCFIICYYIDKE